MPLGPDVRRRWRGVMLALLALTLIQMVLGTQVRETVDAVKNGPIDVARTSWLDTESTIYLIHRSFSWVVLALTGVFWWLRRGVSMPSWLHRIGTWIIVLVLSQIAFGVGLERLGMPGALQVLHLTTVAILICLQFAFVLAVWDAVEHPEGVRGSRIQPGQSLSPIDASS